MSHKQFLETKCDLCGTRRFAEMPEYRPPSSDDWKKVFDPPKGWVDISADTHAAGIHVCSKCAEAVINERAKVVSFEKVEAAKKEVVSIADLMGDES